MKQINIDIETFSSEPLAKCGVYKYAESPDFEILLFGYAVDGGEVQVVDLTAGESIPKEIINALTDDSVIKWAYNAQFERICISRFLGLPTGQYLDPASWHCTMVWAATLGLPLSLDTVGSALKLEKQKLKEGKDLIRYFCTPSKNREGQMIRHYPKDAPDRWVTFKAYNKRDVETEMGIQAKIAWRVLDAQYWGVPQRRKRIFLVADFAGKRAGKILFESEGLSGYSAQSLRSWQETACRAGKGTPATSLCLNDQGGNRMDVSEDVTNTLRAEAHHPPCVMENKDNSGAFRKGKHSAGFCTEHSAKSRTIGYEEEKSPTLRAGTVPAAVALDNHPIDSRIKVSENGVFETLTSRMGTGGNNVPLVMKIRSGCEGGGKGPLIQTDKSATLSCNNDQTLFEPKVYGICSKDSNAMKSDNPNSGFYEADTSRTIDGNGVNPSCNQGGMAVVCVDQGGGKSSCNITEEQAPTLTCTHGGEPVVAFTQNQRNEVRDLGEASGTLPAQPGMKQQTFVLQSGESAPMPVSAQTATSRKQATRRRSITIRNIYKHITNGSMSASTPTKVLRVPVPNDVMVSKK